MPKQTEVQPLSHYLALHSFGQDKEAREAESKDEAQPKSNVLQN